MAAPVMAAGRERPIDDRLTPRPSRRPARTTAPVAAVVVLCLLPVAVGAGVMAAGGADAARWRGHLVVGVFGATLCVALAATCRSRDARFTSVAVVVVLAAVAATLLAPGLDGVHRWLDLGQFRVHAGALVAPSLIVIAALDAARGRTRGFAVLAMLQAVHVLQPDAGQATVVAAAAATMVLLLRPAHRTTATTTALALAGVALGALAWLRADPLQPVAFVEDVLARAAALSPAAGTLSVLALTCLVLAPLLVALRCRRDPGVVAAGGALAAGFAGAIAASLLGAFPVPLLGFSPSAVLGAFVGVGVLLRTSRRDVRGPM
jgi:hypothetical protein